MVKDDGVQLINNLSYFIKGDVNELIARSDKAVTAEELAVWIDQPMNSMIQEHEQLLKTYKELCEKAGYKPNWM